MPMPLMNDADIPPDVFAATESWQRIISGSCPAAACENLRQAFRELRGLAKARPDADFVGDYIEENLVYMAEEVGIDPSTIQEESATTDGWSEPTPITSTLPAVKTFTPELLPDVIRDYVLDVAERQQAPPDFAAVAALCGIAAVIGNRVRICPKQYDDWEVVPNLWGAIIGRPSAKKTPAIQAALAPVYAIEADLRKVWEEKTKKAKIGAKIDAKMFALAEDVAKGKAKKKLQTITEENNEEEEKNETARTEARKIIAGVVPNGGDASDEPCPRIVINDATVEKLGELLNQNPRGVLLTRDELSGFLARMEAEEHQSERAFYLEAANGVGRFIYDRIGRGTVPIENCTVSMVGGMQPSRIAPIVRGAMSGASNDGLVQRLQMLVWPDDVKSWRYVDETPNALARLSYEKIFRDLYELSPAVLRFSAESQDLFRQWMVEIHTEALSGSLPSTLESHILKMPKTVATLALLFELIDGGRAEVTGVSTARALDWADYLKSHANRLYSAGEIMFEDGARLIIARRHNLPGEFTVRDIHQKSWAGLGDIAIVKAAIQMLICTNHCREVVVVSPVNASGGRKPSKKYSWNPRLDEKKKG